MQSALFIEQKRSENIFSQEDAAKISEFQENFLALLKKDQNLTEENKNLPISNHVLRKH